MSAGRIAGLGATRDFHHGLLADDDGRAERPEVAHHVFQGALACFEVTQRGDVLRRVQLKAETLLRSKHLAATDGDRQRLLEDRGLVLVQEVAEEGHPEASLDEEALRHPGPELHDAKQEGGANRRPSPSSHATSRPASVFALTRAPMLPRRCQVCE